MALLAEQKLAIIKKYRQDENDTGSPEVQIALLTASIPVWKLPPCLRNYVLLHNLKPLLRLR